MNLVGLVVYGAVNFVIIVVLTAGFDAPTVGAVLTSIAAFNILVRTCAVGADLGMVRAVSRSLAVGRPRDVPTIARVALRPVVAVAVAAAVVLFASAARVAELIGSDDVRAELTAALRVLAVVLPIATVYAVVESASRGYGTMKPSVVVEKVGKSSAQLVLIAIGTTFTIGAGAVMALWAIPIGAALIAIALWTAQLQRRAAGRSPAAPEPTPRGEISEQFWRFARPRALAGAFQVGVVWSDTLLVGALVSTSAAAIYASATRVLLMGSFVQLAIGQAVQPRVSARFAEGDHVGVRRMYQTGTAWIVLVTWPIFLTIAVFGPVVLQVFGDDYAEAASVLAVLGVAWLVATGCGPVDSILLMAGRSWTATLNLGLALALNVGLNIVLIPAHGITGAAVSWAVAIVFLNLAPLAQIWRSDRLHPFGSALRTAAPLALVCFGVVGVALRTLGGATLGMLAATLVVGGGAYATSVFALRRPLELAAFAGRARRGR